MTRRTQRQRPRRLGIVSWMRLLAGAPVWLLGATVAACELQPEIQRIGVCGGQHCRDEVEFALHCREVEVVYVQGRRTARVVGLEILVSRLSSIHAKGVVARSGRLIVIEFE